MPLTTPHTLSRNTMTFHLLDRPVWPALSTRMAHVAVGGERARRFVSEYGLFAAARDDEPESLQALADLVPQDNVALLIQTGSSPLPSGTSVQMTAECVQMVAAGFQPLNIDPRFEQLTKADAPAMLALAALTEPGPFFSRTNELGQFWGVKENGMLVAMAGERMRFDGYTEVSGVCTHPDFRGRGYAGQVLIAVASHIARRGDTPFLHALTTNTPAIKLYETLGFATRTTVTVQMLRRA